MINVHTKFYKLSANPFRLTSDFRFSFGHKSYTNAIIYMEFGFDSEEGFIVITGRPGTGKTTLINQVISEIDARKFEVANLVTTQYESHDLLNMIAASFNLDIDAASKSSILLALQKFLKRKHTEGKRVLLIVDEAQGLTVNSLEELRQLSNFQVDGTPLLQIFLIGQEELRDLIESPGMEQLRQRIVASSHLDPLTESETIEYVTHRLKCAEWKADPAITRNAVKVVHHFSGGIPRIINLICGRLLLYGCNKQKHDLNAQDMISVIEELSTELLIIDYDISPVEFVEGLESSENQYLSTGIKEEFIVSDSCIMESEFDVQAKADHSITADERRFVGNTVKNVDDHARELLGNQTPVVSEKELEKEVVVPAEPVNIKDDRDTNIRAMDKKVPEKKTRFSMYTKAGVLVGLIITSLLVILFSKWLGIPEIMATDNQPDVAKTQVKNTDEQLALRMLPISDNASKTMPPEVDTIKSDQPSQDIRIVKLSEPVNQSMQNTVSNKMQQVLTDTAAMHREQTVEEVNQFSDFSVPEESLRINEQELAEPEKTQDLNLLIDKLLNQADQQISKKQLMTPIEDSAWQSYQEILRLDPGNELALAGIRNIAKTYVTWAIVEIKKGNFQHAEYLFNKALEVSPDDKDASSGIAGLGNYNR